MNTNNEIDWYDYEIPIYKFESETFGVRLGCSVIGIGMLLLMCYLVGIDIRDLFGGMPWFIAVFFVFVILGLLSFLTGNILPFGIFEQQISLKILRSGISYKSKSFYSKNYTTKQNILWGKVTKISISDFQISGDDHKTNFITIWYRENSDNNPLDYILISCDNFSTDKPDFEAFINSLPNKLNEKIIWE